MPSNQLENVTSGINALRQLDILEANLGASGIGTGTINKGLAAFGMHQSAQNSKLLKIR